MNVSCGFSDSSLKTSNSRGKAFDWRHQEGPEFDVCAAVCGLHVWDGNTFRTL